MSEPALTLTGGEVAEAAGGRVVRGDARAPFGVFGIDSRAIVAGQLFVAIAGERHDGHAFVGDALDRGARGVVVAAGRGEAAVGREDQPAVVPEPIVIEVSDTTVALQRMGRAMRRKSGARLIAITGSAGKTTTKEVAAAFLALRHQTCRNRGNLNNHIGLPLSLLELGRDGAVPSMAGEIEKSIRALGFKPEEIKILLTTQAHFDHAGTMAHFAALSKASVRIMQGDERLIADGGRSDYLFGKQTEFNYAPVKVDVVLKDGDVITLGGVSLTALRTPGHTPGCATYTMSVPTRARPTRWCFPAARPSTPARGW